MSPELFKKYFYGKKIDIWGLGCILVEMITLYTPFKGNCVQTLKIIFYPYDFIRILKNINIVKI